MTVIGPEVELVDEPAAVTPPVATDTCFLLFNVSGLSAPTEVQSAAAARAAWPSASRLLAYTDAYFGEGGGRLVVVPLAALRDGGDDADDPELIEDALALIGDEYGPGQVVAPTVTANGGHAVIASWAWETNRHYILNAADGEADEDLALLAEAIRGHGARVTEPTADTLIIPGIGSGSTREVMAPIVVAAIYARNDLAGAHPNTSAAGVNGICRYVIGIKAERTREARNTLAESGVNCFRTYAGTIRNYGTRTAVDRDADPAWTQAHGSRTVMAVRARELAVAEELAHQTIDGEGRLLDRYAGALSGFLADLEQAGALYRTATGRGYRVQVDAANNPVGQLAQGIVTARITLRVSPSLENPRIEITRRLITQEV